jgi:hypothetical protein
VSRRQDPRERLRRANPVPPDEAASADTPGARALFERIVATASSEETPREAPRRTWVRRRAWILVPALVVALSAAGYGISRRVSKPLLVACYQQPSLKANRAEVPPIGRDPLSACRPLWKPGAKFNPAGRAVPSLTSCVLNSGAVGVFPSIAGSDTCRALGLAHPVEGDTKSDENQVVLKVEGALADRFLSACLTRPEAIELARSELSRNGLHDWKVVSNSPFTAQEPCASAAYDLDQRTITLIPVSAPASP